MVERPAALRRTPGRLLSSVVVPRLAGGLVHDGAAPVVAGRAYARAVRVSHAVVARARDGAGAVVVVVVVAVSVVVVRVVDLPHRDILLVVVVFLGLGAETHGRFAVDVNAGCRGCRGHGYVGGGGGGEELRQFYAWA
jgi:hypothetical protein